LKPESPWVFYPRYALETAVKAFRYWRGFQAEKKIVRRVMNDPRRGDYTDLALQRADPEELANFDLYQQTTGGAEAVAKKLGQEALFDRVRAAGKMEPAAAGDPRRSATPTL
jgi:hypothetical protein